MALSSVGQIAADLNVRIESLAADILPNGKRRGREWTVGSLAGEPGKSLSIALSGPMQGRWKDFASGEGGDALDLVAGALFRGDKADAVQWAKDWLGLDSSADGGPRIRRPAPPPRDPARDAREREAAIDKARRKFAGCIHRIAGTPVDHYLRGRAIELRRLGRQPGRLAFHPALWCEETQDKRPAMVAAICQGGRVVGIHRTYLAETHDDDTGEIFWKKAGGLETPKKTLGPWQGGCIPLWRGADIELAPGRSISLGWRDLWERDDLEPGSLSVTLTEGIEDALSLALADPGRRVAAAVSLSGLAGVVLPPAIGEVTIAADNESGEGDVLRKKLAALDRAIDAHSRCGRRVLVSRAPAPFKDFNEWLQAITKEEGRVAA